MTADEFCVAYSSQCRELKLPIPPQDMAAWLAGRDITSDSLDAIQALLSEQVRRKREAQICTLKKLSRLPQKAPCRFDNFDMSLLNETARKQLLALRTLSFIKAKRNVIMIGPPGTGKTHLAMAIGNACCEALMKTYFIKMDELKGRFLEALRSGCCARFLEALSKYSCLIVDEVGYCHFDKHETLLFFQLVDRFSVKESGSIVLTSNKDTSLWKDLFEEDDALECTIDRLWDKALCYTFSGRSYRGQQQDIYSLDFLSLKN